MSNPRARTPSSGNGIGGISVNPISGDFHRVGIAHLEELIHGVQVETLFLDNVSVAVYGEPIIPTLILLNSPGMSYFTS
jgi:hypothetical protein